MFDGVKSSVADPEPDPHVFGLQISDRETLVLGMDSDPTPDPSIIKQNNKKNLDSYCFVTSL
jgi:hypothetical protein